MKFNFPVYVEKKLSLTASLEERIRQIAELEHVTENDAYLVLLGAACDEYDGQYTQQGPVQVETDPVLPTTTQIAAVPRPPAATTTVEEKEVEAKPKRRFAPNPSYAHISNVKPCAHCGKEITKPTWVSKRNWATRTHRCADCQKPWTHRKGKERAKPVAPPGKLPVGMVTKTPEGPIPTERCDNPKCPKTFRKFVEGSGFYMQSPAGEDLAFCTLNCKTAYVENVDKLSYTKRVTVPSEPSTA